MTTTERAKGKPGSYVYNDVGFVIGRIKDDLTEDKRYTAEGKCSIANGIVKATGYTPRNPQNFDKEIRRNPNKYVLMGYTICLEVSELPVEMWCVKAAELLGNEYEDLQDMLKDLSKQPEVERKAKLTALSKMFAKEKKAIEKKDQLSPIAKKQIDEFFDNWKENLDRCLSLENIKGRYGDHWYYSYMFLVFSPEYHTVPFKLNWYALWRQYSSTKVRDRGKVRDYFQHKLNQHINDKSIPKRYRDLEYARKLAYRFLKLKNNKARNEFWRGQWEKDRHKGFVDCIDVKTLKDEKGWSTKQAVDFVKAYPYRDLSLKTSCLNYSDELNYLTHLEKVGLFTYGADQEPDSN